MDELICKQQAIDAPKELIANGTNKGMVFGKDAVHRIEMLPSAQPKMGRWIHDGSKWANRWICSECGYKWFFDCIEGAYCPNCGADMRQRGER